jgi:hypothetical protein
MLWAVAGRFGFDGHNMAIGRLAFWYRGHFEMINQERALAGLPPLTWPGGRNRGE